jgi:hypothetical protein
MPTLAARTGDAVSVCIDNAGAEETVAIWDLRAGRLEGAVLALRRAQRQLRDAEMELLERILKRGMPGAHKKTGMA